MICSKYVFKISGEHLKEVKKLKLEISFPRALAVDDPVVPASDIQQLLNEL